MWDIGLRARFFWIILAVMSLVVVATSILHGEFLRQEKLNLIDQQVRDTATALLDSQFGDLRKIDFDRIEELISEELGENRIGKFFVIRNNAGDILFESTGTKLLPLSEIPRSPRWITLRSKGQYIRILNLDLPRIDDRTLQVGVVIGEELVSPGYFSRANMIFTAAIMCFGLLVAWGLTSLLMKPISRLATFVEAAAKEPSQKMELPSLPSDLKALYANAKMSDELVQLLVGFQTLIDRVNRDYRVSRFWSYQMAHELKTPMALIEMHIADAQKNASLSNEVAKTIMDEVFEMSETISSFLAWAEIENLTGQKLLHVVRASKLVTDIHRRLEAGFKGRLDIHIRHDFSLMTNIQHAEQAVGNLIVNALSYSSGPVFVEVLEDAIEIKDSGPGLPNAVLQRLGEPFNKGENALGEHNKANGLGLALVHSIVRLYKWKIDFETSSLGTTVKMQFPSISPDNLT